MACFMRVPRLFTLSEIKKLIDSGGSRSSPTYANDDYTASAFPLGESQSVSTCFTTLIEIRSWPKKKNSVPREITIFHIVSMSTKIIRIVCKFSLSFANITRCIRYFQSITLPEAPPRRRLPTNNFY